MRGHRQPITRRDVLRGASAAGMLAFAPHLRAAEWSNWSGWQKAQPRQLLFARSEAEIAAAVKAAREVRAFGGSHSFSPIVPCNDTMISLEAMNGIIDHDAATHRATLWAGTRLANASMQLAELGQSLLNEPDINLQSMAGLINTAVHGTGRTLQCFSACVTALRLVTASGEVLSCSAAENTELFEAARVGIGSLGVITQLTLQNAPLYKLRETVHLMSLDDTLATVQRDKDKHRHIECWAFIDGDEGIVKIQDIVDAADTPPPAPSVDENRMLDFFARVARRAPWLNTAIQDLVGWFVEDSERIGPAWKIFPSLRTVPFNEREYQLPLETGFECFEEVRHTMRAADVQVVFPLEFRFVKGDDCWLSPFYGRDSISISAHQYYKQDYRPLFALLEPVFRKYGGRPHWGKLHTQTAADFAGMYPRWQDFLRVREHYDPGGKFLNPHMRDVFGIEG